MTAPVIRQFAGTIPDKGQSQSAFDTNVDAFLDWQALQFAPDLVAFGTFASNTTAALVAGNLPSLTGRELDAVRVNAAGDDVEFADVTAAGWALLDDADAAAQRVTLGVRVIDAPGTAPLFACRAWANFNGVGTVAILASGNVSSITDNGIGDYTINFATDMPDNNYAVAGSACSNDERTFQIQSTTFDGDPATKDTSAVRILSMNNTSAKDSGNISVAIFR